MPDWIIDWWQKATVVLPPASRLVVWVTAAVVLVTLSYPPIWHVLRHLVTMIHEAGHALAAVLSGRRLNGIRVHADTSGLTSSSGRGRGPGMVFTAFAGYPAPGLLGLGLAWLLTNGYAVGALWVLLVLLVLILAYMRNLYGWWVVGLGTAALVGLTGWASVEVQQIGAYAVTWLLLLGAPRAVVELGRSRSPGSDADRLAQLTHVPAGFWIGLFWLVTVGYAVGGGWLLVQPTLV